jgi:hypothetical protein
MKISRVTEGYDVDAVFQIIGNLSSGLETELWHLIRKEAEENEQFPRLFEVKSVELTGTHVGKDGAATDSFVLMDVIVSFNRYGEETETESIFRVHLFSDGSGVAHWSGGAVFSAEAA